MLGLHFTQACVLLLVCGLHFTHSLHFTPGPQSTVRSPQSAVSTFYTDRIRSIDLVTNTIKSDSGPQFKSNEFREYCDTDNQIRECSFE